MNRFLCALVLFVTPFLVAANKVEEKAAAGDWAQLLGKWIVRSVQRDGKPTPAQIGREVGDVITFKKTGHQFEISWADIIDRAVRTTTLTKLDVTKDPKQIDLALDFQQLLSSGVELQVHNQGWMKGIYKLEDDKLIYCLAAPGKPRPQKFSTPKGSG